MVLFNEINDLVGQMTIKYIMLNWGGEEIVLQYQTLAGEMPQVNRLRLLVHFGSWWGNGLTLNHLLEVV